MYYKKHFHLPVLLNRSGNKQIIFFFTVILLLFLYSCTSKKQLQLNEEVEVIRDQHGINHIYANNQSDLFFMQGYLAAKDRLFQFEIWRRQATGTVSEIFGESELDRDIGTRLFKFRGNIEDELNHYHEDGYEIITHTKIGKIAYIYFQFKHKHHVSVIDTFITRTDFKNIFEIEISTDTRLIGNPGIILEVTYYCQCSCSQTLSIPQIGFCLLKRWVFHL